MYTKISELKTGEDCVIHGWVEKFRDLKMVQFLIVSDISGSVQVTIDKSTSKCALDSITTGSTIILHGHATTNPSVKLGGVEFVPDDIKIETLADIFPISSDSSADLKYDYRWLDLRSPDKRLIFQTQTMVVEALRRYLIDREFIEIHTPKLSAISSEGGSEVFKTNYFGRDVFLTQSPQLY